MAENIMGRTHFAGLFELIQVCSVHRRDVEITFTQSGNTATLHIQDGQLCDASCDDFRGDDAVYEIFRWSDSFFELVPLSGEVERTIIGSNTEILMHAAEETANLGRKHFGPGDRIAGPLDVLSTTELLQLFEINCRNALLRLKNDGRIGNIHLREGRAVHATLDDAEGDRAVLDLLLWPEGDFVVEFAEEFVPETVIDSISGLVMEGSRRIDLLAHIAEEERKTRKEVADQMVRQLEEADLGAEDRILLAKSYQPPGKSMAVVDLLELVTHTNENVRRNALENISHLPPPILKAILEDKNTPNAVRYCVSPEA